MPRGFTHPRWPGTLVPASWRTAQRPWTRFSSPTPRPVDGRAVFYSRAAVGALASPPRHGGVDRRIHRLRKTARLLGAGRRGRRAIDAGHAAVLVVVCSAIWTLRLHRIGGRQRIRPFSPSTLHAPGFVAAARHHSRPGRRRLSRTPLSPVARAADERRTDEPMVRRDPACRDDGLLSGGPLDA